MSRSNGNSSNNKNSNNKNSNNANNASNKGGGNNRGGRKRKKSRKKPRMDPVKYWGDASGLPTRTDYLLDAADPTAVIRSLGKAPIPGKNSAPELYFDVLYERAASLAQALAIAGGLNSEPPEDAEAAAEADG